MGNQCRLANTDILYDLRHVLVKSWAETQKLAQAGEQWLKITKTEGNKDLNDFLQILEGY